MGQQVGQQSAAGCGMDHDMKGAEMRHRMRRGGWEPPGSSGGQGGVGGSPGAQHEQPPGSGSRNRSPVGTSLTHASPPPIPHFPPRTRNNSGTKKNPAHLHQRKGQGKERQLRPRNHEAIQARGDPCPAAENRLAEDVGAGEAGAHQAAGHVGQACTEREGGRVGGGDGGGHPECGCVGIQTGCKGAWVGGRNGWEKCV